MANKISVLIDVAVDKGVSSLKRFKTSVQEAEGFSGKLKAGFGSMAESVKANAGMLATAAGAALVTFGVKAVGAFTDTALAADDMSKSTGLAVEDASRWIAVGDDYGITAENVAAGLGKITTAIDDSKWKKYGIETRDAAGKARDANAIMLDTFDALAKETNATERSRMAKELLGKGYANLAPLIGKTRGELESYLGSVEAGQVVTSEEAEKARKWSLALDQLQDAFREITLAVGGVVAEAGPMLKLFAKEIEVFAKGVNLVLKPVDTAFREIGQAISGEVLDLSGVDGLMESMVGAKVAAKKLGEETAVGAGHLRDLERGADKAKDATRRLDDAVRALNGELDQEEAVLAYQEAISKFADALTDSEASANDQQHALIDAKRAALDYVTSLGTIPTDKKTEIVAAIDQGNFVLVQKMIDDLVKQRVIDIRASFSGNSGAPKSAPGRGQVPLADGGIVRARSGGTSALIAEGGVDEAVVPLTRSNLAAIGGGGGGSPNVSIVINGGSKDARQIYNELAAEARRRGVPYFG